MDCRSIDFTYSLGVMQARGKQTANPFTLAYKWGTPVIPCHQPGHRPFLGRAVGCRTRFSCPLKARQVISESQSFSVVLHVGCDVVLCVFFVWLPFVGIFSTVKGRLGFRQTSAENSSWNAVILPELSERRWTPVGLGLC